MKKNVTYIDQSKFEQIVRDAGLPWREQSGFVKVTGAPGRNVYVANTKRVGRVDISGFLFEADGVTTLGEGEIFGAVGQQLDFSRTEPEILGTFAALLDHMRTLEPRERRPSQRATEVHQAGPTTLVPTPEEHEARLAERRALIARVAAEKGVAISPLAFDNESPALAADDDSSPVDAGEIEDLPAA